MRIDKEKLKKEWEKEKIAWSKLNKEDYDFVKSEVLKSYNALSNYKIVKAIYSILKYTLMTTVMLFLSVIVAGSILMLMLSHEALTLFIMLVNLLFTVYVYYREFLGIDILDIIKKEFHNDK